MSAKLIYLASQSDIKYNALNAAIKLKFQDSTNIVVSKEEAKSLVGEQPYGRAVIRAGALNRLNAVKKLPCVSLETGIIKRDDAHYDITCCLLRTRFGLYEAWSDAVLIPEEFMEEWFALPNKEGITVGSLIYNKLSTNGNNANILHFTAPDNWNRLVNNTEWRDRHYYMSRLIQDVFDQWKATFVSMPMPIIPAECVLFKGVSFLDIQDPLCNYPSELMTTVKKLTNNLLFDTIVALDARGFLFVAEFARAGYPTVMARKKGKLPSKELTEPCSKQYGADTLSIKEDAIKPGARVVVLDDVIATGGSVMAVERLVKRAGGEVVAFIAPYAIVDDKTNTLMCNEDIIDRVRFLCTDLEIQNNYTFKFKDVKPMFVRYNKLNLNNMVCHQEPVYVVAPSLRSLIPEELQVPVNWGNFKYSSNIWFKRNVFRGKHVYVLLNTMVPNELVDVLSLLTILYRKRPTEVTVVIPFFEQSTQDRVEYNNGMESLAQVDTIPKLIGNYRIVTFDLHAEQSRTTPSFNLEYYSIVEELWNLYFQENPDSVPVFPDDGAHKRFGKMPNIKNAVVFRKKRDGDKRIIATDSKDEDINAKRYVIIDDAVRSGGTMCAVAQYLLEHGATGVDSLFAHGPLEPNTGHNMRLFNDIWTSDTCPLHVPSSWVKVRVIDMLRKYDN